MVFCIGCDRATKSVAVSVLPETKVFSYLGDTIRLQLDYNRGAFLSLGSTLPEVWRQGILALGTGVMLLGALAFAFLSKPGRTSVVFAIALICAGGVGNLFDRVTHGGMVVDFINLGIGSVRTGIFNVADVAITLGVIILFCTAFPLQKKECLSVISHRTRGPSRFARRGLR